MKGYAYPAVFTAESRGLYSVNFPDLKIAIPAEMIPLMLLKWQKTCFHLLLKSMKRIISIFPNRRIWKVFHVMITRLLN